jgi:hypothetical protein
MKMARVLVLILLGALIAGDPDVYASGRSRRVPCTPCPCACPMELNVVPPRPRPDGKQMTVEELTRLVLGMIDLVDAGNRARLDPILAGLFGTTNTQNTDQIVNDLRDRLRESMGKSDDESTFRRRVREIRNDPTLKGGEIFDISRELARANGEE